ncbi:MAG: ATP-binding cassette domain-containing protein [Chloroflexota bacterium]|nr:ATP-binding cassette domain-containing protein [Chloroflexota bacterium]
MIEVEQLVKQYNSLTAVNGISFEVGRGEIFGFLGPNGAGKTTTIKIITTLLNPTSGRASVAGYDVQKEPGKVRSVIGYVAQDVSVDDKGTGRENLMLQGRLHHIDGKSLRKRIDELLELVDLTADANRLAETYSGGMRKRLDLVTGLVHRPEVLFLDEPTLGLDPQTRAKVWTYLRELNQKEGITLFLTTHYMEEADELCHRVAIIDHGEIKALDHPDVLKDEIGGDCINVGLSEELFFEESALVERAFQVIQGQPYVKRVETLADSFAVYVDKGDEIIPHIVELLRQIGIPVKTLTLSRPSLQDVFLKHTGTTIRDSEASSAEQFREFHSRVLRRRPR